MQMVGQAFLTTRKGGKTDFSGQFTIQMVGQVFPTTK